MADKFYAWTTFKVHDDDDPLNSRAVTVFKPGDEITPEDLGLTGTDDPEWVAYVDSNAVRTIPHPEMAGWGGSPVEFAKAKLAAAAEGEDFFDFQHGVAKVPTEEEVRAIEGGSGSKPEAAQATPTPQKEVPKPQ